MKKIIAIAVAALLLAGCSNNTANESTSSATSAEISSESVSSSVSTSVEENSSTTESSSAPVESSSSASSLSTTEKPVSSSSSSSSSSSTKPVEKPVSSSTNKPTSSSTKIEEKPIHTHNFTEATCTNPATCISCGETKGTTVNHNYNNGSCIYCGKNDPNYVAPHNCKNDPFDSPNHDWEITYTTTEPKWCEEMHIVTDYGYDVTLAARYLGVTEGEAIQIFWDNMEAIGVNGAGGSATTTVKVWGTETFETRECKNCGLCHDKGRISINPLSEWQFLNGKNPRMPDPRLDFNTIFYDPYNVPQKVIDNILLLDELRWG